MKGYKFFLDRLQGYRRRQKKFREEEKVEELQKEKFQNKQNKK